MGVGAQVRQHVDHKRSFFLLEQLILKHSAHTNTVSVKNAPDGESPLHSTPLPPRHVFHLHPPRQNMHALWKSVGGSSRVGKRE